MENMAPPPGENGEHNPHPENEEHAPLLVRMENMTPHVDIPQTPWNKHMPASLPCQTTEIRLPNGRRTIKIFISI